jgi:acyl dehydratase
VDPERAAATRFGGTVAHGFLTLSMLSAMAYDAMPLRGEMSVNYGFDRIRFLAPVPSGARVRARFALAGSEERSPGETTHHWDVTVEIEGAAERPALVARWITRRYEGAA